MHFPTKALANLWLQMKGHSGIQILLLVDEKNNIWEVI